MNIPKEIIEKAIEGNYEGLTQHDLDTDNYNAETWYKIALDPSFWQALFPYNALDGHDDRECNCLKRYEWKEEAHNFYDLVLTEGDTDAFWHEILSAHTQ